MIRLAAGVLALEVDPDLGAAVMGFTWRETAVLRPVADPRLLAFGETAVAAYPLLPFVNRIGHARFVWRGTAHALARNFGDHPHAIHGNGFMRPWRVRRSTADSALLSLRHAPPDDPAAQWPFAYEAEQDFVLAPDRLTLTLRLRNSDRVEWPASLGWHPFFPREAAASLGFVAQDVWRSGADALPAERVPVAGLWDFAAPRPLGDALIDECYTGWRGSATIGLPGRGLALRLEATAPLGFAQLYVPPGRDFFAFEPVSAMPDAIHRMDSVPDNGLVVLAPGEALTATVTLRVEAP